MWRALPARSWSSHRRAASRHSPAERGEERQAPRRREMRPLGRGSLRAGEFPVAQRGCDCVNASAHPADVEREAIQLRKFEVEIASISSGPAALRIGKRKHRAHFRRLPNFAREFHQRPEFGGAPRPPGGRPQLGEPHENVVRVDGGMPAKGADAASGAGGARTRESHRAEAPHGLPRHSSPAPAKAGR